MTGSMFAGAGPEETERRVEQWAADFAAKADRYQQMQARISQVRATESSSDGMVQVTVDSGGVVTDLVLSDRAGQVRPQQLSAQILDTMRRAQSRLTDQVQQVMVGTVGDDPATVQAVVSNYEQRFPEPPPLDLGAGVGGQDMRIGHVEEPEDPGSGIPRPSHLQPPPPPTRRPASDDDDWDDGPLMR
ncbi:MAG TPA: YbaB/EbfC family nucleoid-associated protein [Pseudonocardiaceae bacterium]